MAKCSGCAGACNCNLTEGSGVIITGDGSSGDPFIISSDGGSGLPAATEFTTELMPNPVTTGDMTVVTFSEDNPVLAIGIVGDTFPRYLINSSSNDGIYLGDGTYDAYSTGPNIFCSGQDLHIRAVEINLGVGSNELRVTNFGIVGFADTGDSIALQADGGTAEITLDTLGFTHVAGNLGFFNTVPVTQPTGVTARVALQNLGLGAALIAEGGGVSIDGAGTGAVAAAHSGDTVTASGTRSIAIGRTALATQGDNIAIGAFSRANNNGNAIALGSGVDATAAPLADGSGAIAIGGSNAAGVAGARAVGNQGVAIGSGNGGARPGASAAGTEAIAIGIQSVGSGNASVTLGSSATGSGTDVVAVGRNSTASSTGAIAIGGAGTPTTSAAASAIGAIAIGSTVSGSTGAKATAASAIAIGSANGGNGASATEVACIAIGIQSEASGQFGSVAIGGTAIASGGYAVALGETVTASSLQAIAVGRNASANTGTQAIAIGGGVNATAAPVATGQGGIAIGASNGVAVAGARASAIGSVAIGSGTAAVVGASSTHAGAIVLGSGVASTNTNQLNIGTNRLFVGAPTTAPADADLVNSQLSFWINEADSTLVIKVKDSSGTVKTFLGALV